MEIKYEDEFIRVIDYMNYWVLEDKTKLNKPIHKKGYNPEGTGFLVDTVLISVGSETLVAGVRYYYPKDEFPLGYVIDVAKRQSMKYRKYRAKYGGEYGGF